MSRAFRTWAAATGSESLAATTSYTIDDEANMHLLIVSVCSAVAVGAFAASAFAAPIAYTFSGIATGTLGSVSVSNAPFTIAGQTDTDNVIQAPMSSNVLFTTTPSAFMIVTGWL